MEFPARFPFDTSHSHPLECDGCGCAYVDAHAPSVGCQQPLCGCHETYWDSVPELGHGGKREAWGDR